MKKTVIIVIGVILCLLIVGVASAQKIDQDRMDRDLAVATNVLKSMMTEGGRGMILWGGGENVEANYLEDYGVIFSLANSDFLFRSNIRVAPELAEVIEISDAPPVLREKEIQEEMARAEREMERANREIERAEQEMVRAERERERAAQGMMEYRFSTGQSKDVVETAKSFLVDYSNLIGQLKPDDKIMIKFRNNNSVRFLYQAMVVTANSDQPRPISAEIKVSDVTAYKTGKIDREEALNRVIVTEAKDVAVEEDVRLFSGILKTVYEQGISKTFWMSESAGIERLEDFGVIYYARFYSSNPLGFGDNVKHNMPTQGLKEISQADRDKKVKELVGPFVESLKENLVEYGRTINSLDGDDNVVIKARLTKCTDCGIPETVEISVKASVLQDYSAGKINKNSAVSKVTVKEVGKQ